VISVTSKKVDYFNPVSLTITFEDQKSLDMFASMCNHSDLTNINGDLSVMCKELSNLGGNPSRYINDITMSLKEEYGRN
jgi:hypothetical protein